MKIKNKLILVLIMVFLMSTIAIYTCLAKDTYYCPMHPSYTADKPGDCPICNMKLVKKATEHKAHQEKPKTEKGSEKKAGVYISSEKQQYIGVKKEVVQKRKLVKEIRTVGRVAYDPELFIAQQEYLEALKAVEKTQDSLPLIKEQIKALAGAAKQKLLLLGMSEKEISDLAHAGNAQQNLYLPLKEEMAWVYITIYEYEVGLIKEGLPIEVEAVAYPGEIFAGEIVSLTPVLETMTRSIKARATVRNSENKLKPEMFVDVKIKIDLGEKLAIPEEAVMDTGERKVIFVAQPDGHFLSREVKVGQKAEGYYEVLEGLSEGEVVVTSGNFFIDAESKLKSALSGESHQHGQ
ncbi:MAG: efflux RND transporter periplasmic adaptor subunit [Candidatus Omnitrophota bacterium]|nr:efflux RND transporter periplasmic adaptor subunit [Candidatus Omnitrophota bacterium]